ncbi:hypothetical protein ACFLS9_06340 [Bacteroidota bacterium]
MTQRNLVNSDHLDYLCEDISIENTDMTIVHIYAEYPDYKWVDDLDEGTSCVDDVSRAAVFYLKDYKYNKNRLSLDRAINLLEFIIYMQSESGYFYNFIFPDHSINKDHKNSVNQPSWWTWRALWAMTEAYSIIEYIDNQLAERYMSTINKTIDAVKDYLTLEKKIETIRGFEIPAWLPYKYASDQAALLTICLSNYYNISNDTGILKHINLLADGIQLMQIDDSTSKFYGAMLSWKNVWHAWGNLQSYALLRAFQVTNNSSYLESALEEINNYYQHLYRIKYLNEFYVNKENNKIFETNIKIYSQIAYGIRPMVFAALEAYSITNEEKYARYAANYTSWFFGDNHHKEQIYFPDTGICFDGLNDRSLNRNSGAESTIEALLLLQEIDQNKITRSHLNEIDNER